jgi:threonine aldolase
MQTIDLRSDTVTLPTAEMLEAMKQAKLGDDVMEEDPTVKALEEMAAKKFGKESALLVPSGTMANLVAVMTHCRHGDEMICDANAHVYYYEVGAVTAIAGVIPRLVEGKRGIFSVGQLESAYRGQELHFPNTSLLEIENTHNRGGGSVWPLADIKAACDFAHDNNLKVHMDGARVFNASVASGVSVKKYAEKVDSLMFCLSKGLSCPVGSLIVGDKDFIAKARKNRKMVGGGMRQAGIIAAPGIIALNKMIDRLRDDHDNAKLMAKGLANEIGLKLDPSSVETNIVVADVSPMTSEKFIDFATEQGVLALSFGKYAVRFVTHRGIEKEHIEEALNRFTKLK